MTVSILEEYESLFTISTFVLDFLRSAGWWLIRGLVFLVGVSEEALYQIFSFQDFFTDPEVTAYFATLRPIIWIGAALAFGVLGLQYLLGRVEQSKKILQNVVFAVIILSTLPMLMDVASDLTFAAIGDMSHQPGEYFSTGILRDSITDLLLYDAEGFSSDLGAVNNLSEESAPRINPNEVIQPKEAENREVFENRLTYSQGGTPSLVSLDQGFLDVFKEYYYRYRINWGGVIVTLAMVAFSLAMTAIKAARLLYELAFHQLFASLLAFFDIASGQRLKKVLSSIIATFAVIALIPVLLQLYLLGCSFAQRTLEGFAYVLALGSLSFGLIDGPNLVQAVLGVDAGIGSAFKTMAGLFYGAKTAGLALKAGGRLAGAGVMLAGGAAAGGIVATLGLTGIAKGAYEAMQNNRPAAPKPQQSGGSSSNPFYGSSLPGNDTQRFGDGSSDRPIEPYQPGGAPPGGSPGPSSPKGPGRGPTPGGERPQGRAKPPDVEYQPTPKAPAEAPASGTGKAPENTPNQYKPLGQYAADYMKDKFHNSKLYKNSVKAHEIGFNAAYGATDRTLKKAESDRANQPHGSHFVPPPLHLWEPPHPEQNSAASAVSQLTHPQTPQLKEGETNHAAPDSR